jgi:hypothetical protein
MNAIIRIILTVWYGLKNKRFSVSDIVTAATMFGFISERIKNAMTKCTCVKVDDVLKGRFSDCKNIVDKSN